LISYSGSHTNAACPERLTPAELLNPIIAPVRQHLLRRIGVRFWRDVSIVSGATLLAGVGHLAPAFIWAMVFVLCGEFSRLARAFYSFGS